MFAGLGELGSSCQALRFSPDGSLLLVAEAASEQISVFEVRPASTGAGKELELKSRFGEGVLCMGLKDFVFSSSDRILVTVGSRSSILSIGLDDPAEPPHELVLALVNDKPAHPAVLDLIGSRLYVLDPLSPRVQVYERD